VAKKWRLDFWKSDGFVGLLVGGVVLAVSATGWLQGLERKAYDIGVGLSAREASDRIALIAIDKQSIDNIGRWPWSREVFADMIDRLARAEAKTIGTTVLLSEPQRDAGLGYVERLIELNSARLGAEQAERAARTDAIARAAARGAAATKVGPGDTAADAISLDMPARDDPLASLLAEAEDKLNTDRRLAGALERAGNVVLPLLLRIGDPAGRPDQLLPEFVAAHAVRALHEDAMPLPALAIDAGIIDTLGRHAAAVGHLNALPDVDGVLRDEALLLDYHGQAVPALSLSIAAHSLNLTSRDIAVRAPDLVQLGRLRIATDPALRMRPFFYAARDGAPAFVADSFFDVLTGKIPPEKYRDKIVLIGPTAAGIGSFFVTPAAPSMASVEVLAHAVSSILSEHYFVAPPWAPWAETGAFALVALYLIFLLPRLSAGMGAALTLVLLLALLLAHFGMMVTQAMWLQLMTAATLLLVGHLLLTTKRFLVTERGKEKSEAEAVFRHMAGHDPKFRDLEQRLTRDGQGRKGLSVPADLSAALDMAARSDAGRVRSGNEDAVLTNPALGFAVLADGMGGHNAGEVASGMAIAYIGNELGRAADTPCAGEQMREIVGQANAAIYQTAQTQPRYAGMGTTLVALRFFDDRLAVAHVGDSRLYRLRDGRLLQLTRDHSLLQEQIDGGLIDAEQARHSTNRNVVTRALGAEPRVGVEVAEHAVRVGDLYLACSDGLSDMVADGEIAACLRQMGDKPEACACALVRLANEHGGRDNVSVILVRIRRAFSAAGGARTGWRARLQTWFNWRLRPPTTDAQDG